MSFLVDPPLLVATGAAIERAPLKEGTRRTLGVAVLAVFLGTSISLWGNARWTHWLARACGAESGRDWMINSGVLDLEHEEVGAPAHTLAAVLFATYPLWLRLGRRLGA
jgi:hypothetical protein